jgi:hypothetical protein
VRPSIAVKVAAALLLLASVESVMAMQPCPSQDERLKSAEIVVEARVRSLTIGNSGISVAKETNVRMIRAELDVVNVIKGDIKTKDIVAYGSLWSFELFRPLTITALAYGSTPNDSLHIELSVEKFAEDDVSLYVLAGCNYWKLPDELASAATGDYN